jgi:hypothetical protein
MASDGMSETEIALMDAIKTLAEIFMYAHPGAEKYLTRAFEHQAQAKIQLGQPDAAAMFALLHEFVASPERGSNRAAIRKFLEEPPQGQA